MTTNQKHQELAMRCNLILAERHNQDPWLVEMAEALLSCLEAEARKLFMCSACGVESLDEPAESDCHCFIDGRHWVESAVYNAPPVPVLKLPDEWSERVETDEEFGYESGWNGAIAEVKRLNGVES